MNLIDDSSYWRARAEEARITADCMIDVGCNRIMLRIAEDYDRIAQWLDGRPGQHNARPGGTAPN